MFTAQAQAIRGGKMWFWFGFGSYKIKFGLDRWTKTIFKPYINKCGHGFSLNYG